MRRIIGPTGFLAVLFFAVPFALRAQAAFGSISLGLLSLLFLGMAASLTPEVAAWLQDVRDTMREFGISQKAAAIAASVSEPTMANWLSGKERGPLTLPALFGPQFQVALAKRTITRLSDAAVIERGPLCDLVNAVQAMTAEQRRPRLVNRTPHSEVA
jgi:hypothetical protein